MRKVIDLTGKKFGTFTVVGKSDKNKYYWMCRCDCGHYREFYGKAIKDGFIPICYKCGDRKQDLVGKVFGKLTVIMKSNTKKYHNKYWLCKCECGNFKDVFHGSLTGGLASSCGRCGFVGLLPGSRIGHYIVLENCGSKKTFDLVMCMCAECGAIKTVNVNSLIEQSNGKRKFSENHGRCCRGCSSVHVSERFGKLLVTDVIGNICKVKCDCGNIRFYKRWNLLNGTISSCGCGRSERALKRNLEWAETGYNPRLRTNHGVFNSIKMNSGIHYDSSYEKRAMELWETDPTISSFNRSKDRITYVNPVDGSSHVYLPDFIIDDTRMIEVKPQYKLDDSVVQAKAAAAEAYCSERGMTYEIWTEHELGIIK